MAILKCKMCGAELQILNDSSIAECEYCGSKQTVPRIDDNKKIGLFNRANTFRSQSEFDKASGLYEAIIMDEPNNAEAHWGVCLCRYGIEYVEDPKTKKRIPTCHRTQYKSIFEDSDYLAAIENSDDDAKEVYHTEAKYIDSVQKRILSISSKEDPFDIFICYKETDDSGDRTADSVIAQELYTELTECGYKVFFSRITLEDKIGIEYEPYIFAALNSSKVMLVVGTKQEYFNAVWVKNEWTRFLSLIISGQHKTLVPCYRNMTPEEMPKEFGVLQAVDVSKIGWKQDLLRGIKKIIPQKQANKTASFQHKGNDADETISSIQKKRELTDKDISVAVTIIQSMNRLDCRLKSATDIVVKESIKGYIRSLFHEVAYIVDKRNQNDWKVRWLCFCLYKQFGEYLLEPCNSAQIDELFDDVYSIAPDNIKPTILKEKESLTPNYTIWAVKPQNITTNNQATRHETQNNKIKQQVPVARKPQKLFSVMVLLCGLSFTFIPFLIVIFSGTWDGSYELCMTVFKLAAIIATIILCTINLRNTKRKNATTNGLIAFVFPCIPASGLYIFCKWIGKGIAGSSDSGPMFYGWLLYIFMFIVVIVDNIKNKHKY